MLQCKRGRGGVQPTLAMHPCTFFNISLPFTGTVPRDFRLLVFFINQSPPPPQAPEYTNRAVTNFFENSRRYSQFKVHHQCRWHLWQMEQIFNQKNFNYFVRRSLGRRVNIYKIFALKFTLRCLHLDIVPIICHRCLWQRWKIFRRCRWYWWQFATSTLTCEYLREFSKNFEMTLLLFSWAWGKVIHEKKTWSKKSRDTVPLIHNDDLYVLPILLLFLQQVIAWKECCRPSTAWPRGAWRRPRPSSTTWILQWTPAKERYIQLHDRRWNSWKYNFVEVSGHNLEISQTWGFNHCFCLSTKFYKLKTRFFSSDLIVLYRFLKP